MSAWIVSKRHIDVMVQSALVGPTDLHRWNPMSDGFSWYHNGTHRLDLTAEVGDESAPAVAGFSGLELVPPSVLGQRLWNENRRSVDHRYGEENEEHLYAFAPVYEDGVTTIGASGLTQTLKPLVPAAELVKGIACYEYQSCEHAGWEGSEAHAFCEAMEDMILHSLPGWESAPWGWD